jgi:ABC-type polysaccharide/polyol phosphate transport system ATPase subunit
MSLQKGDEIDLLGDVNAGFATMMRPLKDVDPASLPGGEVKVRGSVRPVLL